MESQMAQGLADLRALREAHSRSQQYLCQLLRRLAMAGPAVPGPSRMVSEKPRDLKRRRIVEESEEEVEEKEEVEKEGEEAEEEEENEVPVPKKAKTATSEKGKEKEKE
ncbi:hypothetical protein F5876DRAFT_70605 [Lentinula aff. lateritia]|uniref:Uncharacterized protein n=1 Tax=Lentinula aff. lateritia TaxID=2804960 RepID=A0ACC1TIM3_9AGAR|nr:hypothetical protein F5876DRAFT_70605 [Lentinula aff. lateritia]